MAEPLPFKPRRKSRWTHVEDYAERGKRGWFSAVTAVLSLAAFAAVFAWGLPAGLAPPSGQTAASDRESAHFPLCDGPVRVTCVVDGDTFWYRGAKIRVADINTPEVGQPRCAAEAALGAQATRRLAALLNQGPFTLEPVERNRDRYDRLLRVVTRRGESLGGALVAEGLAEEWQGTRGSWC